MPKPINTAIRDSARENEWRFDALIHLGGTSLCDSWPEVLEEALREEPAEIAIAIGVSARKADHVIADDLPDIIQRKGTYGLLAKVAAPVRTYYEEDGAELFSSSWGEYTYQWLYAEDLEALLPKIELWLERRRSEDRARSLSASSAE